MEPIHGQEWDADWLFKQAAYCTCKGDPECERDCPAIFLRLPLHGVTKHILLCGHLNTYFNLGLVSCAPSNIASPYLILIVIV